MQDQLHNVRLPPFHRRLWIVFRRAVGLLGAGRFDNLWYALMTRVRGLDLAPASVDELGLSPARAHLHANSGGPYLRRVLRALGIPDGSSIVDLGSGKGGALLTFAEFPFSEILGVEISEDLVRIARANLGRAGLADVCLQCADAAAFAEFDRFSHVYMFNPFPTPVVQEVMANLAASLPRQPRDLTLIVKWPEHPRGVVNQNLFGEPRVYRFPCSQSFYVYERRRECANPVAVSSVPPCSAAS